MQYESELEENVVTVLGRIYSRVQWRKMGSRSAYDIYEHRLEYARHEPDLPSLIQKLCDRLSIQAPSNADGLDDFLHALNYCRQHEKEALQMIRTRGKLLTLLAAKWSKEMRA